MEVPIASSITEVTDGSVSYRGQPIEDLIAAGRHYENAAELLWTGRSAPTSTWPTTASISGAVARSIEALPGHASPTDRIMAGVVAAGATDAFSDHRSVDGVTTSGRILIRAIVDSLPGGSVAAHEAADDRLAHRLWIRLTEESDDAWPVLDTALLILADHGMATSTLAARLAASTRAAPHAVVLAGLGALAGPLHGGASRMVHDLFSAAERHGADKALADVIHRDGKVPGIGHFIHRTRDPRHDILFDAIAVSDLDPDRMDVVASVVARTAERIPAAPNIDLALGALTFISGMDSAAGEVVFAIARTAGWLAHALEEYDETPIRFRPVGRYVGP